MKLGIDLGTSMAKVAAFDDRGHCIAIAARETILQHLGQGRIEQDFEQLFETVCEIIQEVLVKTKQNPTVVGITGQSDGLWLFDENGFAVAPAVSWLDDRGNPYLQHWIDSGVFDQVFQISGNAIFPGSMAPLMAALHDKTPEVLSRAHTASYLKDAILQRLTGVRITDASDTSLPFLNTLSREYDPKILEMLGLDRYRHLLAPIMLAPGQTFVVTQTGSDCTGLPVGTPVHAGPFDLPACAIGAGVRNVGDGLIIIGTTLACEVLVDRVDTDQPSVGMTLCMPQQGRWIRAMPAMVGTAALDWTLSMIGRKAQDLDIILGDSQPGANGVMALPYFSATGERAPFVDVNARGLFTGMTTSTTPADLAMATCESIAYAARHCIQAAGLSGDLYVCGGGSNSATWLQMFADVLQHPLKVARRPEVGARGAAMAAMQAAGYGFDPVEWTEPETTIQPNPAVAKLYKTGFDTYMSLIKAIQPTWRPKQ